MYLTVKIYFHMIVDAGKYLSYRDVHKNKKYVCRYESYFAKCALTGVLAGCEESEWIHVFLRLYSQSECWGLSLQDIIFNSLHNLKFQITVHLAEFRGFICKYPSSSSSHPGFSSFNPICIPCLFLTFLSIVMFSDIFWEDCLPLCCWWFSFVSIEFLYFQCNFFLLSHFWGPNWMYIYGSYWL